MYQRWRGVMGKLCNDDPTIKSVYDSVIAPGYGGAARAYHSLEHVSELLHWLSQVEESGQHDSLNFDVLNLTAWFHDVVYQPLEKDNEEASARLAEFHLKVLGVPLTLVDHVAHIIRRTQNHTQNNVADTRETHFFLDADLAILGSSPNRYARYQQQVRAEYHMVDSSLYRAGRASILRNFLNMEFIYRTDFFRTRLESPARTNIDLELTALEA